MINKMFTTVAVLAALLGSAGVANASPLTPKICVKHEDSGAIHTKGDIYVTGCVEGPGNGGAFADADGDGIPNGVDDDRNGGPVKK